MMLRAEEIEVRYDKDAPAILRGVTVGVAPGEFLGIVGPNGSGKSTLIRALSRALRPASGTVTLGEKNLYDALSAREAARHIGVVPQNTSVAFAFTVREVVEMGRTPHLPKRPFAGPTPADAKIVEDALRAADVDGLQERIVTTLSGGEMQRVLLARALAQSPSVLLLDEPTAHLDIHFQTAILARVRHLVAARSLAAVAVLHDLNLASFFCDRLVLLNQGRIVAQGTADDVLTAEVLASVYGASVWIGPHPATGRPIVLPGI